MKSSLNISNWLRIVNEMTEDYKWKAELYKWIYESDIFARNIYDSYESSNRIWNCNQTDFIHLSTSKQGLTSRVSRWSTKELKYTAADEKIGESSKWQKQIWILYIQW